MLAKDKIFREYDIRGTVDVDFDAAFAKELGRAFASEVLGAESGATPTVAVGSDCRLSGPTLTASLIEGLTEGGLNVIRTGVGPTPQLYYTVFTKKLAGGIQVTGSHNPADQNGFKMMIGLKTLSGNDIQSLRKIVTEGSARVVPQELRGSVEDFDARSVYTKELIERSKPFMGSIKKLKVVTDAGNGVGGLVGPEMLRQLGCEVIEMYSEPDGRFPNHHPDPTELKNIVELRARVVSEKADLGIGWDGDADRIGVVNELGEPVFGDMLLVLFGRQLLKEVEAPTIIADVKCSELFFSDMKSRGANAVMSKTGHSLIKAKLKELHAELAGEMSGHIFFAHRYYGFDDAMHASARLVEILSHTKESLSSLLGDLPKTVSTPELRIDCADEIKFEVVAKAQNAFKEFDTNTIDGVRITFSHGWGLVRASNTQSALVMRFEADTEARLKEYQKLVEDRVTKLTKELSL